MNLRDQFQGMLATTAANLELTAEALCRAADAYARTDHAAAVEFDRLKSDSPPVYPITVDKVRYPE